MRFLAIAGMLALTGCSSSLYLRSPDVPPGGVLPGQSSIGGSLEVRSASSAAASVLFALGLISITSHGAAPALPVARLPVYPLDPQRSIHEQDCTQPIDISGGNLRCR
jgi:hypothetical protein